MAKSLGFGLGDFDTGSEDGPSDTDDIEDKTLEALGWWRPLGYRLLSRIIGSTSQDLKEKIWLKLLTPLSRSYEHVDFYFENSQCHTFKMKLNTVFQIYQYDVPSLPQKSENIKLLWHGTKLQNVRGILTQGFIPSPHNPSGQMFGNGLYFADRVSKSAQYCDGTSVSGTKGYLFLCEVDLGQSYVAYSAKNDYTDAPKGCHSVFGVGQNIPDKSEERIFGNGCVVPCGKTIQAKGVTSVTPLRYNEYVVYDVRRISIKFLVDFEII